MSRARDVVRLFGCFVCGARWWTRHQAGEADPSPGHQCPEGAPSGGIDLGLWQELAHPQSEGE
jgi:hypothetical protein